MRFKNSNSTYNKKTYTGKLVPQNRNGLVVIAIVLLVAVALVGAASAYTVTYDGNGATSGTVPAAPTVYAEGDTVTVLGNTEGLINNTNKFFAGWNTVPNPTTENPGIQYLGGTSNTSFAMPSNDVTLYAQWATGYTELEYIESTGGTTGAYIDTGHVLTGNSSSEIVFKRDVIDSYGIFGSRSGADPKNIAVSDASTLGNFGLIADFNMSRYEYTRASIKDISTDTKIKVVLKHDLRAIYNYDNGVVIKSNSVCAATDFVTPSSAFIFYVNGNFFTENKFEGIIYSCKISESGTLVRNFIPCICNAGVDAGKVGMYDTVDGKFYGNASGTGSFTPGYFKVTYDGNGGSWATSKVHDVTEDDNIVTLDSGSGLTKEGYYFAGWNTNADGTGVSYAPEQPVAVLSNLSLYAVWVDDGKYLFTYNANGADGGTAPASVTVNSGGTEEERSVTVSDNIGSLTRSGYYFAGWNTKADGTGYPYAAGSTFSNITGNVTLYAKWNKCYNVTYYPNDATSGVAPLDTTMYKPGDSVTVKDAGTLEKTESYFAGWQIDGTGTTYPVGDTFTMPAGNVTLYAKWIGHVSYDGNGATSGEVPEDTGNPHPAGTPVTVLDNTGDLKKTDCAFVGWTCDQELTTTGGTIPAGNLIPVDTVFTMPSGNVTLYAKWMPVTIVTLDKNSGDNDPVPGTVPEIYGYAVAGVTFTTAAKCSGYTLDGWYTESSGGSKILNADGTYSGVKNIAGWIDGDGKWINSNTTATLYAHWTDALKYYVYIPSGVTLQSTPVEGTYKIKILTQGPADGKSVVLRYSSSAHAVGSTKYVVLSGDSDEKMSYTVTKTESDTDIQPGTEIVLLSTSSPAGTEESVVLTYSGVNSTGKKAGSYSDTLTFTVSVEKLQTLQLTGGTWKDSYGHVITSVDVQEGSTITVDDNKIIFVKLGCDDIVLTHSATQTVLEIGTSANMREVKTGTTTVLATDTTLDWGLPVGYTEVEYIESTGTQYIDTGWYFPSTGSSFELDTKYNVVTYRLWDMICGVGDTGSNQFYMFAEGPSSGYVRMHNSNPEACLDFSTGGIGADTTANMSYSDGTTTGTVNGNSKSYSRSISNRGENTVYLFATHNLGASSPTKNSKIKMYYYRIYEDTILVRNFIPCINPLGKVGMYDTVTSTFYGNSGTGDDFIAGDPVS